MGRVCALVRKTIICQRLLSWFGYNTTCLNDDFLHGNTDQKNLSYQMLCVAFFCSTLLQVLLNSRPL
jgi:hypothetical protein